jgi:hypothetical protein
VTNTLPAGASLERGLCGRCDTRAGHRRFRKRPRPRVAIVTTRPVAFRCGMAVWCEQSGLAQMGVAPGPCEKRPALEDDERNRPCERGHQGNNNHRVDQSRMHDRPNSGLNPV